MFICLLSYKSCPHRTLLILKLGDMLFLFKIFLKILMGSSVKMRQKVWILLAWTSCIAAYICHSLRHAFDVTSHAGRVSWYEGDPNSRLNLFFQALLLF